MFTALQGSFCGFNLMLTDDLCELKLSLAVTRREFIQIPKEMIQVTTQHWLAGLFPRLR